jgi:hypothetical protein
MHLGEPGYEPPRPPKTASLDRTRG